MVINGKEEDVVHYVEHFDHVDDEPDTNLWECSLYSEVKLWHALSAEKLRSRADLAVPSGLQDAKKTLQIYRDALYPYMIEHNLTELVEDNASPHNNETIRSEHAKQV